jgi:hypothetical protein
MTIKIERRGGYAGLEEKLASVNLQELPKAIADQLRERLAHLSRLASQNVASVGADQFHYSIEVDEPGAALRTLTVVDEGNPDDPALQSLMAILELLGTTLR